MKHSPKSGKRKGPVGFRTSSTFLHRKAQQVKSLKRGGLKYRKER